MKDKKQGSSTATIASGASATTPTGAAGGDLSGTYPNPTVAQSSAANFTPAADNAQNVGSTAKRWANFMGGAFQSFNAASDANPAAKLSAGQLAFGAGGASALDTFLIRESAGFMSASLNGTVGDGSFKAGKLYARNVGAGSNPFFDANAATQEMRLTGTLNMQSSKITGLANGTAASDAATVGQLGKAGLMGSGQGGNNVFYPLMGGRAAGDATEGKAEVLADRAMTLAELRMRNGDAALPGTLTTVVFTVRLNGADTALTVTFNANDAQNTLKSITGQSIAVVAGDRLSLKSVTTGSGTVPYFSWGVSLA